MKANKAKRLKELEATVGESGDLVRKPQERRGTHLRLVGIAAAQ